MRRIDPRVRARRTSLFPRRPATPFGPPPIRRAETVHRWRPCNDPLFCTAPRPPNASTGGHHWKRTLPTQWAHLPRRALPPPAAQQRRRRRHTPSPAWLARPSANPPALLPRRPRESPPASGQRCRLSGQRGRGPACTLPEMAHRQGLADRPTQARRRRCRHRVVAAAHEGRLRVSAAQPARRVAERVPPRHGQRGGQPPCRGRHHPRRGSQPRRRPRCHHRGSCRRLWPPAPPPLRRLWFLPRPPLLSLRGVSLLPLPPRPLLQSPGGVWLMPPPTLLSPALAAAACVHRGPR